MVITLVAEELCIKAVTAAPIPTPAKRLLEIFPNSFFRPLPVVFSSPSLSIFIPLMNTPHPINKASRLKNISIMGLLLFTYLVYKKGNI